jgi:hypothetical protein
MSTLDETLSEGRKRTQFYLDTRTLQKCSGETDGNIPENIEETNAV